MKAETVSKIHGCIPMMPCYVCQVFKYSVKTFPKGFHELMLKRFGIITEISNENQESKK